MADVNVTETEKTRQRVFRTTFFNAEGETGNRVTLDVERMKIEVVGTDYVIDCDFDELPGFTSLPKPSVVRAAAAFGLHTSITNTGGAAKMSLDEKWEAADARKEKLWTNQWTSERESGPRTNDLVEAAARVQSARGKPWTEDAKAEFAKKLADDPEFAKKLQTNDQFRAALDAIKLERAQARAAKSAEKAAAGSDDDLDDLLS